MTENSYANDDKTGATMSANAPYQLLPDLSAEEFAALKADIAERGVLVPVEVDEAGAILDGHHRLRAWSELRAEGLRVPDYPRIVRSGLAEVDKRSLVRALNLTRRHLSAVQRRAVIAEALAEEPRRSDRSHAAALGVGHKTVAAVRRGLVGRGALPHVEVRTDTLGRHQPATRPSILVSSARDEVRARAALLAMGDRAPGRVLELRKAEEKARLAHLARRRSEEVPAIVEGEGWRIECCDFRELDIDTASVDAIVCDPPYVDEAIPLWSDL
ncbi:MAG: hypothetical protein ACYDAD_13760, partial [Acidimicrobiales bacterium]